MNTKSKSVMLIDQGYDNDEPDYYFDGEVVDDDY